jgi:uncharacterized protein (TIGR02145 family)
MDGDPLTPVAFNLQANGFPVAFGGGDIPLEFTSSDTITGWFNSVGLKTIVNIGDYWMVADFQGQIITDSDVDNDGDGFTENQGDCDDNNAAIYPPVIPNQEITICSGDTFVFDPMNNPPTTLVPEGTTYTWIVTDNLDEIDGESSTNSHQSQISQTLNNYGGVFYGISYEVTPYSPSGCEGQTFELIVYVTLPTVLFPIDDMVLMNGESRDIDLIVNNPDNKATVAHDWVSDIDFGAGLIGSGNGYFAFTGANSSSIPITGIVTLSATVAYNGISCEAPLETFTITVNPDADTVTDQDGNTYDYLTYGDQVWTVDNAEMVTYRDGSPIPQVTDATQWSNLSTGAWCYVYNSQSNEKLYNWYAVAGIHDDDPNTPNKEFAPEGWHVPTDAEWTELEDYLIINGYNYDGTTEGNKIAKAMASTTGWPFNSNEGRPGYYAETNNSSGFNSYPKGYRDYSGNFTFVGSSSIFISANSSNDNLSYNWRGIFSGGIGFVRQYNNENTSGDPTFYNRFKKRGQSVRFVRD